MISLTDQSIDLSALVQQASQPAAGAVVAFVGITRQFTAGKQTLQLRYEAYQSMAQAKLAELEAAARQRWQLVECLLVHRLGEVPVSEASIAVVVSSPHRRVAFEAAEWLIDRLKQDVPIWKQEQFRDGTTEWVHPGASCSDPGTVEAARATGCKP